MKKVGLKALFFTIILSMVFAGSAFAFNAADHVSVAPNGKGDVVIFPAYFTGSGWETKLVVTNTSLTRSVVAKVIIRSKENSQELRDFFIYLSPADVWTGTLYENSTTGQTHIMSTDDSCISNDGTNFASETNPFDFYLEDACAGDTNALGYVTVIQGASFAIAPNQPGVAKADIRAAWNAYTAPLNPVNVLAGQMEITNTLANSSFGINATVLKNYDYNIATKMTIQNETRLGENANNVAGEIEAALSKDNLVIPYYSRTLGSALSVVSFPTKLASFANCTVRTLWTNQFVGFPTPQYTLTAYDLQENFTTSPVFVSPTPRVVNTFPSEVNFLYIGDVNSAFDEGWIHIDGNFYLTAVNNAAGGQNFTFTGFPMIASSMRFDSNGNASWLYNAHTLGTVDFDGNGVANLDSEYNYHYWGQADSN